jgi:hypothetical protein
VRGGEVAVKILLIEQSNCVENPVETGPEVLDEVCPTENMDRIMREINGGMKVIGFKLG